MTNPIVVSRNFANASINLTHIQYVRFVDVWMNCSQAINLKEINDTSYGNGSYRLEVVKKHVHFE